MGVGTEIDQVEAIVVIDELDQLTAGITGSTENRRANHYESPSIRICGWNDGRRPLASSPCVASWPSHVTRHKSHVGRGTCDVRRLQMIGL